MKEDHSRALRVYARRLPAVAALLLMTAGAALAQGAPSGVGAPVTRDPKGETNEQTSRETLLRRGEMGAAMSQLNQQRLAAAIEQTKQDFKRIQLIRNDVVDDLVAKKPLDYKLTARRAGEVNERALRLKSFLMPSAVKQEDEQKKDEQKPSVEYDAEGLKGALVRLCNTIFSFTGNPMFQDPNTVDVQKATKAGGDLLDIIELSGSIKGSAEKLAAPPK